MRSLALLVLVAFGPFTPGVLAGEVRLDFTTNINVHAAGWTPVTLAANAANVVDVGGSGYDFTIVNVGAYDNGNSGQPLTRSGFHTNFGGSPAPVRTFTLSGLTEGQAVSLYACAAWDAGAGGYLVFGDSGPAGVKAETVGNPGIAPTRDNLVLIGTAFADAGGAVSGTLHPRSGVGGTGEGQIGGFIFAPAETITATAGANGTISPEGETPVIAGDEQTFTITPAGGFHIVDVLVDGVSIGARTSYTFTDVQEARTISASFSANTFTHTITATAAGNGTIDPAGSVTPNNGVNQPFEITPDPGHYIVDVKVDNISVGPVSSYLFTNVSTNHTISATFALETFTISASVGPNGTIDPVGDTEAPSGDTLIYFITPDEGYYVSEVLVDGVAVSPDDFYVFDLIDADHTISVIFDNRPRLLLDLTGNSYGWTPVFQVAGQVDLPDVDGWGYDFTFSNVGSYDNGNASQPLTRGGFHNQNNYVTPHVFALDGLVPGQSVALYACAAWNEGQGAYIVYGDTGATGVKAETIGDPGDSPTLANLKFIGTATADVTGRVSGSMHGAGGVETGPEGQIGAMAFIVQPVSDWTITATAGANGTISPAGAVGVDSGGDQAFTITPAGGHHIVDVLVDGASVGAIDNYAFSTVIANHSISATFAPNGATHTINATAGPNGSISPAGLSNVYAGISRIYTITPDTGHHILDVTVDGESVGPVTSHAFTGIAANHAIHATFAIDTFMITASAGANGTISPEGETVVNYGDSPVFTFTPAPGYTVDELVVDGVTVANSGSYTFTNVTGDHTISVGFDNRSKLKLDFTENGSPNADGWIPVYGNETADTNVDIEDVGGSGYSLTFNHVASWDNNNAGQPLTRSGFYTFGGSANDHDFTLGGLNAGQTVALYACAGWDGNGRGGFVVFGDSGANGVQAQIIGDPGTSPSISNLTLIGTAVSDASGTVSGSLYGANFNGTTFTDEGQVGAFMFAISDGGTPPVETPYDEWASDYSLSGNDKLATSDPDFDGVSNILEFALGSDPTEGESRGLSFGRVASIGGQEGVLTLTIACRSGAVFSADGNRLVSAPVDGITYTVEAANDLSDWGGPLVTEVTGGDAAAIQGPLPVPDTEWTYRTFRTDGSAVTDSSDFIRVRAD